MLPKKNMSKYNFDKFTKEWSNSTIFRYCISTVNVYIIGIKKRIVKGYATDEVSVKSSSWMKYSFTTSYNSPFPRNLYKSQIHYFNNADPLRVNTNQISKYIFMKSSLGGISLAKRAKN